jgi:[calcium/calmodulin-dependent protein kinase] kinase
LYAIKIISKDFLKKRKNGKTTETYFEDIKREIAIMKKLLHPNILRLYEVLDDPKVNKMYLVLEYMKKGDLINVLKKRDGNGNDSDFQTLSDFEVWQIFRQLVTGIRYLHFQNIVHGDIKPQNLLLGEDGLVKIADFGISQMLSGSDEQLHDAGGTPAFMAPELCEGKKNFSGQLADIWAIGATIFMLRFGQPPFVAKSIINLYYKICNDPLVFPATPSIEPGLQNLIEGMLEKNPEKRLTIAQIVAHPWYRQPPPPPSLASLAPAVNVMASPMVGNKGRPSVPTPAPAPSTSGSSNNGATTTGSNTPSRPQSSNGGASATAPTSDAAVPTFQPPPSYDDEANEAMKGPIHRTILNNDDVFMSIGNISVTEHEDYEGAIGDVIEEGEDEDSDEEEDNDEDEGGHGKKAKGVKAADKLLGRNRDALIAANKDDGSRSEHKDGSSSNDARRPSRSSANPSPPPPAVAEDKRDKLGRKIKPAAAKAAAKDSDSSDSDDGVGDGDDLVSELASSKSPSKKKSRAATAAAAAAGGESPSLMETGGGDIMGTNWGADVFQMVEDDEDDRGDDDDDEVDVDSDEGNDRFDATRVQANGDTKGKTMVRKESHSEMSEEEEARRSRRFMKKITKKSTENMMRSLPSDGTSGSTGTGAAAASSSAAAGSRSAATAAASSSKAKTASASSSGTQNHSSMAKSQSQPLTLSTPHIGLSSHSTTGSAAQLFPAGPPSQSTGLNSLNTSSTSSSPLLKPGSRSARGDPTRTFSMNSTFDDDEPEALTTEEFQAMMDTLSQQNTQGSRYAGNGVEPIGEEGEGEESSSRAPGGANGGGGSGGSGPSSAQSTLAAGGHRSNSVTDQGLIDVAMQVVWDQIESLKVSYLNPRVKIGGAFHSEQGIRPTQEDRCVLLPNVAAMQALTACDLNPGTKEQLNMFALAGIFDGHDGWRAAQYLAQYLATMLVTHDKFVDPKQLNHAINDTFTSIDLQVSLVGLLHCVACEEAVLM